MLGGGVIKFSHQIIAQPMCEILNISQSKNIPVMLSAVGVEGYDAGFEECLRLKNALNLDCVKTITTRDDIDTLEKFYIVNKKITTGKVADPACSIAELYTHTSIKETPVIGLGIGRKGLFEDYGRLEEESQIIEFWKKLYAEISSNGYKCVLFTNGLPADYQMALEIKRQLNLSDDSVAPRPKTVEELTALIANIDAAIVTRLHSSIIAYSYGIPSIGLVWNSKQLMFGNSIGHPERFLDGLSDERKVLDLMENAMKEENARNENYCSSTQSMIRDFLIQHV